MSKLRHSDPDPEQSEREGEESKGLDSSAPAGPQNDGRDVTRMMDDG